MKHHTIQWKSQQPIDFLDLTGQVKAFVQETGLQQGLLNIASAHTTMGLVLNERCENLQQDMHGFLTRLAPPEAEYRHNQVAVDGRPNAHSHLLALLLPSQLTLVLNAGELELGTWQAIFAIELDGPRPQRNINLTLMGQ